MTEPKIWLERTSVLTDPPGMTDGWLVGEHGETLGFLSLSSSAWVALESVLTEIAGLCAELERYQSESRMFAADCTKLARENAGLREALEAAQAEVSKLRSLFEPAGKTEDDWNDLPFADKLRYRLDRAIADRDHLWQARADAEAERDALRKVFEAADVVAQGYKLLVATGFSVRRESVALIDAVDSYTQSSNPGEKP